MIEEEKQDLIVAELLGSLDPAASGELAASLRGDTELAQFAGELREATAALAHIAPLRRPPPHLRAIVLAAARGETAVPALPPPRNAAIKPARLPDWLPWAIAAGIALAAVVPLARDAGLRTEVARLRAAAEASQREAVQLLERNIALESEKKELAGQTAQLQQALDSWKKRDALAEIRIASLTSALSKSGAIIVWDAEQQRGVVKLSNLPKAAAGKDYQLWVIDPKYSLPVSAGVVTVGNDGSGYGSFTPAQPIGTPDKFAISVERTGGAPAPAGPIILIGD